jgi:hypothetical protein
MTSLWDQLWDDYAAACAAERLQPMREPLLVSLGEKKLLVADAAGGHLSYPVSHSRLPLSCLADSNGTPWGLHAIAARVGAGAVPGTVFVGRRSTQQHYAARPDAGPAQPCLVTTRILRLRGLQPGLNAGPGCDTFDRYIYIHGTNHPARFPDNISAGCLLMTDDDLIYLFDVCHEGQHVFIARPAPAVTKDRPPARR